MATSSNEITATDYKIVMAFLEEWGLFSSVKPEYNVKGAYSKVVGGALKLSSLHKAKISCILTAKPPLLNGVGRLHGLTVASVAERVAIACAKTVVGTDGDLFLGELCISYLSSAPRNAQVIVEASVVSSQNKRTIVEVSFGAVETGRVLYLSRATFYSLPLSTRL
ncbi:hypothetical protein SASPL_106068 [Salvia splendens]|uniref:Thioesterase domain-containing protein n=1 Tax=Salvia splendens TaxID=180675 RepID=A0A8X8YM66_SALSN|nr:uncharacterized protein LOC121779422 [Salvia splendens]KAG6434434.1 hypothetical protein SASPL_106068 [Salvia splendens]